MKKSFAFGIAAILLCFAFSVKASAFPGKEDGKEHWKAQKIAYLTEVMDLTPDEAQTFWPLYNQAEKEKREAFAAVKKAYDALKKGMEEGKPSKEIGALLDGYTAALDASQGIDSKDVSKYKRVLPVEKVAKLFVGEESFRREQIQRLGGKKH